jgi:putative transposase
MVNTTTWGRRALFHAEPWAKLLIDTLYRYRGDASLLHEVVIMPDHIHVIFTPLTSLEKAVQFIKGGFSYRAKKELGSNLEIWEKGFTDHRIRDASDYAIHITYLRENPVRKNLCERAEDYAYSPAHAGFEIDVPQGLKPIALVAAAGAAKAAPFQNNAGAPAGPPFQSNSQSSTTSEGASFQNSTQTENKISNGAIAPGPSKTNKTA